MAYTKTNWRTDDVITAEKLNNAEQGIAQSASQIQENTDDISQLKSEFTATSSELGVYTGVFKSTGVAHSSDTDQVPVSIKAGESFSVRASFDVAVSGYWQCWAIYSDGTSEAVFSYYPNQEASKVAEKDIVAIGITLGAQSSAYVCTVVINAEKSVLRKIEANTEDISSNQKVFEDVVIDLSPVVFNVSWESGRISSDGGNQDSTIYVRTAGYILISKFEYVHLAAKCQIEVFFYNDAEAKISSNIYGSSSSVEQDIYLDYPSGTSKVRVVQYMHNTAWQTTVEYAENDVKFESVSYIKQALDLAEESKNMIGVTAKAITVPAGTNHSASVEADKIYIDSGITSLILSVTSANKAKKNVQAWAYTADSSSAIVSFYSDGRSVGAVLPADTLAIGFTIVNSDSSVADIFTTNVEYLNAIAVDVSKNNSVQKVINARHISGLSSEPLTILHFSDLHEDVTALSRISNAIAKLGINVNDAICTGDIVADTSGQISSWWNEKIMIAMGNHDCATKSGDVYNWTALSMADRDAYYIAPFESNWGITHTSGKSYYYKDYATQKVRLIVMDGMLYMASDQTEANAQTSWLESLLADAITNSYHVLIAIHAPHGGSVAEECSFSRYGQAEMPTYTDCNTPQAVIDAVATKITAGLNFVGYICGHTHQDNIWDAENDNTQHMYCITCAGAFTGLWQNSDQYRSAKADAYNIITIDTANTLVKIVRGGGADIDDHMRTRKAICFDYSTGHKVGEVL